MPPRTRRRLLASVGTAGVAALAGCSLVRFEGWPDTAEGTTDPLPGEPTGWVQYGRDPGHTGYAPEVRVDDPDPVWTYGSGGGMTPPAVVGERLFVQEGAADSNASGSVLALDANGRERWRRDLPGIGGGYSGCPPIVHRGSVYVGGLDGVYALDARDGAPRWGHETDGSVNEAVLGLGGRVFASTGEDLLAFDTRGRERWTYVTGNDRFSNCVPTAGGGYVLYTTRVLGSVVGIQPGTVGDALSEWRYVNDERSFGTPTVANGVAYVPGERLHAADAATGRSIWTADVRASADAATDGDRLYLPTQGGDLVALGLDGRERWRVTLAAAEDTFLRTRPLVTARSVVVTTEKPRPEEQVTTHALDRRTGKTRWRREQPGNIGYDAVALGERIYVPVLWAFTLEREGGATLLALSDRAT